MMEHRDFEPKAMTVRELFTQEKQLTVPRYQRTFAWGEKDIEDFYKDFIETRNTNEEEPLNFIGTILLSDNRDDYEIIDGQQRLLTFTILFAVVRDILEDEIGTNDAKEFASVIQSRYIAFGSKWEIKHGVNQDNNYKLKVGEKVERHFMAQVFLRGASKKPKPKNKVEKRITYAYDTLYDLIKKQVLEGPSKAGDRVVMLHRLLDRILEVACIVIFVRNNEIAFNLFESHNAKGQALAKTDLIKSYYFGRLRGEEEKKLIKMDEWDSNFERLETETDAMAPDRFFSYMLQSYEGNFNSSHLYRRIKPYIDNTSKFESQLRLNLNLMIDLKNSRSDNRAVVQSLEALNDVFNVHPAFILMLSLARNKDYISPKFYEKIFLAIENFSYLYRAVSKLPTNVLERLFSGIAKSIEKKSSDRKPKEKIEIDTFSGQIFSDIQRSFNELLPTFDIFAENFAELSYENGADKKLIRYTFEKIESFNSNNLLRFGTGLSLDHIYAQNTREAKNLKKIHRIGNLTPLSKVTNSSLGNIGLTEKISVYEMNSDLYSIKTALEAIKSNNEYTDEVITNRSKILARYCYDEVFQIR